MIDNGGEIRQYDFGQSIVRELSEEIKRLQNAQKFSMELIQQYHQEAVATQQRIIELEQLLEEKDSMIDDLADTVATLVEKGYHLGVKHV